MARRTLIAGLILALLAFGPGAGAQVIVFPMPQGAQVSPEQGSTTGTTGQITVTLAGAQGRFTYFCGFTISSGGTTSAAVVNTTITGLSTTLNHTYVFVSSGQGLLGVALPTCIPSSAVNTAVTLTVPGGGAGTVVAASIWGYTN